MNDRAGTPATEADLIDVPSLIDAYYTLKPDVSIPEQRVVFGTSGHRGSSLNTAFNQDHIAATTQAIVEYRASQGITGPLFIGSDTHALSGPAQTTALEVLVANGVRVLVDEFDDFVPTPALSHAILKYNAEGNGDQADGIVVTPSHNPPADGGFKYNPRTADLPTPTRPPGSRTAPTSSSPVGCTTSRWRNRLPSRRTTSAATTSTT